jgi:hypothetical protein
MRRIIKQYRFYLAIFLVIILGAGATVVTSAQAVNTTINSTLSPVISLFTTSGTVTDNVTPTGSGAQTIQSDTVTVSTNDSAGYKLVLNESTADQTLKSGSNTIPASSGNQTTPVVMAVNTWGYRVDGVGGFGAGPTSAVSSVAISGSLKFAAIPVAASPDTLANTSGTATNATTTVWYGVAANTSQPTGTYSNTVTYTCTAN